MYCDHCSNDTNCYVSVIYDLCLCNSCYSRFLRKQQYEKEGLANLAAQQRYWESCALPYVYLDES